MSGGVWEPRRSQDLLSHSLQGYATGRLHQNRVPGLETGAYRGTGLLLVWLRLHGGIVDASYGSGLSFRDPDNIALEFFAPPG